MEARVGPELRWRDGSQVLRADRRPGSASGVIATVTSELAEQLTIRLQGEAGCEHELLADDHGEVPRVEIRERVAALTIRVDEARAGGGAFRGQRDARLEPRVRMKGQSSADVGAPRSSKRTARSRPGPARSHVE